MDDVLARHVIYMNLLMHYIPELEKNSYVITQLTYTDFLEHESPPFDSKLVCEIRHLYRHLNLNFMGSETFLQFHLALCSFSFLPADSRELRII